MKVESGRTSEWASQKEEMLLISRSVKSCHYCPHIRLRTGLTLDQGGAAIRRQAVIKSGLKHRPLGASKTSCPTERLFPERRPDIHNQDTRKRWQEGRKRGRREHESARFRQAGVWRRSVLSTATTTSGTQMTFVCLNAGLWFA